MPKNIQDDQNNPETPKMTKISLESYNDQNILRTSKITNIPKTSKMTWNPKNDPNTPESSKMTKIPLELYNDQNILGTPKITKIPQESPKWHKYPWNPKNDQNTQKLPKWPKYLETSKMTNVHQKTYKMIRITLKPLND